MTERKPCPFCGSQESDIDHLYNTRGEAKKLRTQCRSCLASTAWFDTKEEAAAAWNMRDTQSALETTWEKRFDPAGAQIINEDFFALDKATYARNPQTGNCYVHSCQAGEKSRRISRKVFMEMYQTCEKKIAGKNKAHGGKHGAA